MWNLLAGYAGLVSVGQQAYVGLGAYALLALTDWGVQAFVAIPIAAAICALIALPTSLLAFRLRGDYFAVGTWVIAEVYRLLVVRVDSLGGGSGRSLTTLSGFDGVDARGVDLLGRPRGRGRLDGRAATCCCAAGSACR